MGIDLQSIVNGSIKGWKEQKGNSPTSTYTMACRKEKLNMQEKNPLIFQDISDRLNYFQ